MSASAVIYTKHAVGDVPYRADVPVWLHVGDVSHRIDVRRPMQFGELTLLSTGARSRRVDDLGALGALAPRALVKHSISRWGTPIEVGSFFDTRYIEPNNVSHLLMDIIPLCLKVRQACSDVTFVFRSLQPCFRELLAHFGIVPLCTYRPVAGRQFSFRLSRGLSQFAIGAGFDAPVYSYTGEVYSDYIEEGAGPPRLFIARRGLRAPLNTEELHAVLEARGFRIVYLEDYPVGTQIAMIQAAQDIVALHGAALGYLALTRQTRRVIEVFPPNVHHEHFPVGVGHKVGEFHQLIPSFDENVQFNGWPAIFEHKQKPFVVDLAQLERVLD